MKLFIFLALIFPFGAYAQTERANDNGKIKEHLQEDREKVK